MVKDALQANEAEGKTDPYKGIKNTRIGNRWVWVAMGSDIRFCSYYLNIFKR